jgi:hypothetical protein
MCGCKVKRRPRAETITVSLTRDYEPSSPVVKIHIDEPQMIFIGEKVGRYWESPRNTSVCVDIIERLGIPVPTEGQLIKGKLSVRFERE